MKKLCTIIAVITLSGCSATTEKPSNYTMSSVIDLTGNIELTQDYWALSNRNNPRYPVSALKKNISGCVEFSFVISDSGKAQNIEIIKSVPEAIFNKSAMKSLKKFRWKSTKSNSSLKPVLTTLQLDFLIEEPVQNVSKCLKVKP